MTPDMGPLRPNLVPQAYRRLLGLESESLAPGLCVHSCAPLASAGKLSGRLGAEGLLPGTPRYGGRGEGSGSASRRPPSAFLRWVLKLSQGDPTTHSVLYLEGDTGVPLRAMRGALWVDKAPGGGGWTGEQGQGQCEISHPLQTLQRMVFTKVPHPSPGD